MLDLRKRLENVSDSYYEFVDSTLIYAMLDEKHYELINEFLDDNKNVTSSQIIELISNQPDFYDCEIEDDKKVSVC